MLAEKDAQPAVSVLYKDGKSLDVNPGDLSFEDLMTLVNRHAKILQQKEEAQS